MQTNHFLLSKNVKNTESAQLCAFSAPGEGGLKYFFSRHSDLRRHENRFLGLMETGFHAGISPRKRFSCRRRFGWRLKQSFLQPFSLTISLFHSLSLSVFHPFLSPSLSLPISFSYYLSLSLSLPLSISICLSLPPISFSRYLSFTISPSLSLSSQSLFLSPSLSLPLSLFLTLSLSSSLQFL